MEKLAKPIFEGKDQSCKWPYIRLMMNIDGNTAKLHFERYFHELESWLPDEPFFDFEKDQNKTLDFMRTIISQVQSNIGPYQIDFSFFDFYSRLIKYITVQKTMIQN